ncbi:FtsX-like permease family protein [Bacillus sp. FSL E2-8895]|uniref:FtsX-like permease family protein n=1 Tax=Bacillus sp. FSL E2-8895 TaxID=2954600 RepID=UPI0030F87796
MSIFSLALKNITRNLSLYIVYLVSCILSVTIFYMYAAFLSYPKVSGIEQLLIACEFIILLFSCFFISYSYDHFLTERKKEIGIWKTFGASKKQLFIIIVLENSIIGAISILIGIMIGIVLSKSFFDFIGKSLFLSESFSYFFSPIATFFTVILFGVLFFFVSLRSYYKIGRISVLELFQETRKPKDLPRFSKKKFIISLLILVISYVFILNASLPVLLFSFLPVAALLLLGTYLFCSHGLVGTVSYLINKEKKHLNGIRMLIFISLRKKLYYNAKIIFLVSILLSMIMILISSIYLYSELNDQRMRNSHPQPAIFIVDKKQENTLESALEKNFKGEVEGFHKKKWEGILLNSSKGEGKTFILQTDSFFIKDWTETKKDNLLFSKKNENIDMLHIQTNNGNTELIVKNMVEKQAINSVSRIDNVAFVPADTFNELEKGSLPTQHVSFYTLDFKENNKGYSALKKLFETLPLEIKEQSSVRLLHYENTVQLTSVLWIIALFIGFILLIALSSLLWFKLYEDISNDRKIFHSLRKIGLNFNEIKKTLRVQIAIIFFVPIILGGINLFIAIYALQNILGGIKIYSIILIFFIFLVFQLIFFFISNHYYYKKVVHEKNIN